MENEIKKIFKELFNVDSKDFHKDMDVNSVMGWDSLNHLNLVIALEESFNTSFTTDEVIQMTNVKRIFEILMEKNGKE